jgi:hypothetical protein
MARGPADADAEWQIIQSAIARLRASVMAVVFGLCGGVGLFVATAWLLLRGGLMVGKTLSLLGNFFPGYTVTWGGAFVGFVYGALLGGIIGWSLAWLYNMIAYLRDRT